MNRGSRCVLDTQRLPIVWRMQKVGRIIRFMEENNTIHESNLVQLFLINWRRMNKMDALKMIPTSTDQ